MDSQEKASFTITGNHFNNRHSEFVYHTTLKTTAHLTRPHYAKVSPTTNGTDTIVLGIKTSQNIMQVIYKNTEFKDHRKILVDDERLERQVIQTFMFKQPVYTSTNPSSLIIGYKSGLVAYVDCKREKVLGLFNCDVRDKTLQKLQPVSLLAVLPKPQEDQVIVMFEDSTATMYRLGTNAQDLQFVEKIKKFDMKTSFNKALNRFKHKIKNKEGYYYSGYLNDMKPECSNFYAANNDGAGQNPLAYYKFNHRTITDFTVKRHKSFNKTLWRDSKDEELSVMAMTSLDGYLVIFELKAMRPLLSYRGIFGGINSLVFSESCELIALGGQDDNITVLDLNTLTTLVCEGHKSFVSRAIFHTIPLDNRAQKDNKNGASKEEEEYVRIIGGGMDAMLSFWEFKRDVFGSKKWLKVDESQGPIKLEQGKMPKAHVIKPLHMEPVQDSIGWIDMCDNMLIQGGYDGGILTYVVRDVVLPSPPKKKKMEDEWDQVNKETKKEEKVVEKVEKKENKEVVEEIGDDVETKKEEVTGEVESETRAEEGSREVDEKERQREEVLKQDEDEK